MLSWDTLKPKEEKRLQLDNDASGSHDRLQAWAGLHPHQDGLSPTTALAWQSCTH